MDNNYQVLKQLYEFANCFLRTKLDIPNDTIEQEVNFYKNLKVSSLNDVFKRMVVSLKNKQAYDRFIADVELFRDILEDFDPKKVYKKYSSNSEKLFDDFKERFGSNYKMDKSNKKNAWVQYSIGVLSCAKFLNNFKDLDNFNSFINAFSFNEFTIASLPMLLDKEIHGFGFALACDFLKELGYTQYGKPDVHLKDIFFELGLVENKSEYEVFKMLVKISKIVEEDPVKVDKVFWLICSRKHNKNLTSKWDFIEEVKKRFQLKKN